MKVRGIVLAATALIGAVLMYVAIGGAELSERLFYHGGRPTKVGRLLGRAMTAVYGSGVGPSYLVALETIGHRTGRRHEIPLVLADYGGERYLVSMLGERSPWVRNVRVAGGRAVLRHGESREVHLEELPPEERGPVLKAYVERAPGGRPHIPVAPDAPAEAFDEIAAAYPVFRVEPAASTRGT